VEWEIGEVSFQEDGIENFRAHDESLQGRSEAYSSWSEKIVNDSDHSFAPTDSPAGVKNVDSKADAWKGRLGKGYGVSALWKS
jgi:hypothetical protein